LSGSIPLLSTLRKDEATGKLETAQHARVNAGEVFRYALLDGLAKTTRRWPCAGR